MNVARAPECRELTGAVLQARGLPRGLERPRVPQVDLDLARSILGVGALEVNEALEALHDRVEDRVELERLLEGVGVHPLGVGRTVLLEQVELDLDADLGLVAECREPVDDTAQDSARRRAHKLVVGAVDVADHLADALAPGDPPVGVEIGNRDEVREAGVPAREAQAVLDVAGDVPAQHGIGEGEAVRVGALEKAVGGDALSARVALVVVPENLHLAQLAARQRSLKGGLPVAAGARDVVQ